MTKNNKTTLEKLEALLNIVARNIVDVKDEVTDIKSNMATKEDLLKVEFKLDSKIDDVERRLSNKIDHLGDRIDNLETGSIGSLEKRVTVSEKDIRILKQKNV